MHMGWPSRNSPQLPPGSFFTEQLYLTCAWLTWKDKLFPCPMKMPGRVMDGVDMRLVMQRRIDLILERYKLWCEGRYVGPDPKIEIMPGTDWEWREWRKLAQNSGEI